MVGLDDTIDLAKKAKKGKESDYQEHMREIPEGYCGGGGEYRGDEPPLPGIITATPEGLLGGEKVKKKKSSEEEK